MAEKVQKPPSDENVSLKNQEKVPWPNKKDDYEIKDVIGTSRHYFLIFHVHLKKNGEFPSQLLNEQNNNKWSFFLHIIDVHDNPTNLIKINDFNIFRGPDVWILL